MRDDSGKWPAFKAGLKPDIQAEGVLVRHVAPVAQTLISGARDAALSFAKTDSCAGWPDVASGAIYAVSLRRDRILAVGLNAVETGWLEVPQLAVSDVSAGFQVIDLSGEMALEVLKTGTELSLGAPSGSAVRYWNGYEIILYRYAGERSFRLHISSPLFEGLWEMIQRQVRLACDAP